MNKHESCGLKSVWQKFLVSVAWLFAVSALHAQTAIEAVSGSMQGGAEVIRIDLSQPLSAVPTGFSIQSPARIALDFPGISNGMGRSTIDINQGNLKSVSVVQAGDRTRVVLNLDRMVPYETHVDGNAVVVILGAVGTADAATTTFQSAAPALKLVMTPTCT